jgi:translocation and assembly module TamA
MQKAMKCAYFVSFALFPFIAFALDYDVRFVGLDDAKALKALKDASDLVSLQDRPPASINALRYRVQSDIPRLLQILRAYAYYDAVITSHITRERESAQVELLVRPGPQYTLSEYEIFHGNCEELAFSIPPCQTISGNDLGLRVGAPALSVDIVNAELTLLNVLARRGHPLAYIDKRKVEVDMSDKTVKPAVCVQEGPLANFGPSIFFGLKEVHPRYIERRLAWKEGEMYNAALVEETQRRILKSNLFSSVLLNHGDHLDPIGELPMKIRLTEAKHRSVNTSVFYGTVDGPGGSAGWTHRNMRGMGEIFSAFAEWSFRYWVGSVSYAKPDFLRLDQTYKIWAEVSREDINPYLAYTYAAAQRIERVFDRKKSGSIGLEFDYFNVQNSASDGKYVLMGIPVMLKYNATDSDLDPTQNFSVVYQGIPYQSLLHAGQHFVKQRLTGCFYYPLNASKFCVLALRTQFGSIAGARREDIPLPILFLGGSLDDLRGYKYKTVSPRKTTAPDRNKPLGGRSAIFASIETRFRVTPTIGLVPFFDLGTVTDSEHPEVHAKWFKSIGAGLRYFAFFGPLRFDLAFPLNRRKKFGHNNTYVDPILQFYASVGQTF